MSDATGGRPVVRAGHGAPVPAPTGGGEAWEAFEDLRRLCLALAERPTAMGAAASALAEETYVTVLQSVLGGPTGSTAPVADAPAPDAVPPVGPAGEPERA